MEHVNDVIEANLTALTYKDPDALLFKGEQEWELSAWICRACGYTELYAAEPGELGTPESGSV